ncbi:hypothetical protein A0O28_0025750 [Trichoderma guizhouense]|uniref:Uncharacterized protein n=1 Tax=Trichoderma guizhouense TaxID=1491466 RepID=A0A1T3CT39_9HYPO|nr:hypothetical protein A0O28_0025750 [Trichoderma guizhouense]
MEFSTIFTLVPYPKSPSLGDPAIILPIWAFLFLVCLFTKLVTALWPSILFYLSFVVAFAPDKNFVVAAMSWLSLLWLWKPWAAATADLRREVDLAIDFAFLAWFLMAFPFIVLTIWVGLMGVLRLAANAIIRRIHDAMEFELDLEYVAKCYSPMQLESPGDRAMIWLLVASGNSTFISRLIRPPLGINQAGIEAIFRDKRPRRLVKTSIQEQEQSRARLKKFVKECRAEIMAKKEAERIAAAQLNDPKPTPFDSEPVPQSRETPTPVVQVSAWPTVPESDNVAKDVKTTSGFIETQEPADHEESNGESLVGDEEDSKAKEPETSPEEYGESLAQEPEITSVVDDGESPLYTDTQAQEPEISYEKYGESFAEDPESTFVEDGQGPVSESSATVPEAAQEPQTSYEEEGDGLLNIHAVQTDEPEVSFEADEGEGFTEELEVSLEADEGEGLTEDKTSHEEEFDVEMTDADPLEGTVPGLFITSTCGYSNPSEPILPLEVLAPRSPAGQEPGYHYDTRGYSNPTEPILPLEVLVSRSPAGQEPGYHYDTRGSERILPLEVVAPRSPAGQEPGCHYDTRGYMSLSPVVESAQPVVEAQ